MACYNLLDAKGLWDYAKANYVDTGQISDFRDLMNKLSEDIKETTGKDIPPEDVARMIAAPKTVKSAINRLSLADYYRKQTLNDARTFSSKSERSPLMKGIRTAYELPYALKVAGHGPALHMTHAWPYAFDPKMWKIFGPSLMKSWKALTPRGARALADEIMYHVNEQGERELDPSFAQKVLSGLAVDPRKIYDDVNRRADFWGKLGEMTSNGFVGLKYLRSKAWDAIYDTVPEDLRTPEMEKLISNHVNHMTGASPEVSVHEGVRIALFAPSLDVARIKRVSDFGQAVVNSWSHSSPEVRFMARQNMKQWTRVAATVSAMLYMNHLMLKHFFHSNEDINYNDIFKGDWLAGKGPNGRVWQFTGGQVPMIRMALRVVARPKQAGSAVGDYLMGKLNPALQLAKTIRTGETFGHEELPYPFGNRPASFGNAMEVAFTELGPIATEDGIREFSNRMSQQNGIPQAENAKLLDAFFRAGLVTIPAAFGTHTYQPVPSTPKSTPRPPGTISVSKHRRPLGTVR